MSAPACRDVCRAPFSPVLPLAAAAVAAVDAIRREPADAVAGVDAYDRWLSSTPAVPKLLCAFDESPTMMLTAAGLPGARRPLHNHGVDGTSLVIDGGWALLQHAWGSPCSFASTHPAERRALARTPPISGAARLVPSP